jgi:hypothetical protein
MRDVRVPGHSFAIYGRKENSKKKKTVEKKWKASAKMDHDKRLDGTDAHWVSKSNHGLDRIARQRPINGSRKRI